VQINSIDFNDFNACPNFIFKRNDKYLTPSGSSVIEPNDVLLILSDSQEGIDKVNDCLNG